MCATNVSLSLAHIIVTKYNLCFLLFVAFYLFLFSPRVLSSVSPNRRCKLLSECNDVATYKRMYANLRGSVISTACTILHISHILANLNIYYFTIFTVFFYSLRHKAYVRSDDSWNRTSTAKKLRNFFAKPDWKSDCA